MWVFWKIFVLLELPTPPQIEVVKLNVEVAISKKHSTRAVITHDDKGQILNAWAKEHLHCEPFQAEELVILWALELAEVEKFDTIIVEGMWKFVVTFWMEQV